MVLAESKWSFVKKRNELRNFLWEWFMFELLFSKWFPGEKIQHPEEDELHMCVIYYVCKGRYLTEEFVLS